VCPAFTSSGNLLPPNSRTVLAGVEAPPTRTSGPTTTLRGSVKAPGKFASDRVEQSSRAPRDGVVDEETGDTRPRVKTAPSGRGDDPPERSTTAATAAAAATLAAAVPVRIPMCEQYTRAAPGVPTGGTLRN
jgi:hypothetical protein